MDISTLSGTSSNVAITPMPDTLPQAALAQQLWADNNREHPKPAGDDCAPTDREQAAAKVRLSAATESTADHMHDTDAEKSQQDSAEWQQGQAAHEQSVRWAEQGVSADPTDSKRDSAVAILAELQDEPLTGSTAPLEDGVFSPHDEERASEARGHGEMQALQSHACTTLYLSERQLCKLT